MKKSKLTTGLVTSFIAAMSLGACSNNVTDGKGKLVSFTGYDDKDIAILTDDMYADYLKTSSGINNYYKQVIEVLIRNAFAQDKSGKKKLEGIRKNYDQIVNEAKNTVKGDKQKAKENADTNGTSYKKEWQSILSSAGVKDEAELLQHYIYEQEKEVIEDWYFDQHEEDLRKEYLGVDKNGDSTQPTENQKANSQFPYHIRHILVKVEDGGSDYARGTISSSQATKLAETIERLAQGRMTFGEIAKQYSEDSSNTNYGDVGLMTANATGGSVGMVNEFQLGIYAYDNILGGRAEITDAIKNGLGLTSAVADDLFKQLTNETGSGNVSDVLKKLGLGEVPYQKVVELGLAADIESNKATGLKIADGKSSLYPRNILWNKYFNRHNAFVITNRTVNDASDYADTRISTKAATANDNVNLLTKDTGSAYSTGTINVTKYDENATKAVNFAQLTGFKANSALSNNTDFRVLEDENDNVIIGVRSTYGIHLMVIQKSINDFANTDVSLNEYYTTAVPGDKGNNPYPTDDDGNDKLTYVNLIESNNKSDYTTRAETVRSAIKGFDSTYDYRLYDLLSGKDDGTRTTIFKEGSDGLALLEKIDNYVGLQREKNIYDQGEGIAKVWRTYLELLSAQKHIREDIPAEGEYRLVPEGCKIHFYSTDTDVDANEYKEGGLCYVKD